jgi:hypothetical protein
MSLFKNKRIKDRELLDSYRSKPCVVCYFHHTTVAAHIRSVGAGGDDIATNLLPLCYAHHREQHDKGWKYMWDKYWRLKKALIERGWGVNENGLFRDNEEHNERPCTEIST